jgi:hypothetical protein
VSAVLIPWPLVSRSPNARVLPALAGGLVRAVRTESLQAVARWWGVSGSTVLKWRRALGVPENTPGTLRLRQVHADCNLHTPATRAKVAAANRDPARAAVTVTRLRGRRRPPEVVAKMRAALAGRVLTRDWRGNVCRAKKQANRRYPAAGKPWTPADDMLVLSLPPARAARRLGRSVRAVRERRRELAS